MFTSGLNIREIFEKPDKTDSRSVNLWYDADYSFQVYVCTIKKNFIYYSLFFIF